MAMPQFTQKAFLVREYNRKNHGVLKVLERCREKYPDVRFPSRVTAYKNATSCNTNKGRSGRQKTSRCPENIEAVREALDNLEAGAQRISARRNGLSLSSAAFNRITRLDLLLNLYQMIKRHKLLDGDYSNVYTRDLYLT